MSEVGRIRSVKPEAFRSRDLCRVNVAARWTFIGLLCFADDTGRMEDDADAIKADVYLRDHEVTPEVVEGHLNELAKVGLICRYEVASRHYLHVVKFDKHQHPKNPSAPKFPECGVQHEDEQLSLLDESGSTPALPQDGDSSTPSSRSRNRRGGSSSTRGHPLPPGWQPSLKLRDWAKVHPDDNLDRETEKFVNYWAAASGANANKRDWDAAWRNWIIHASEWGGNSNGSRSQAVATEDLDWRGRTS